MKRVAGDLDTRAAVLADRLDGAATSADQSACFYIGDEQAEGVGNAVWIPPRESHDRVGVGAYSSGMAEDVREGELHGVESPRGGYHAIVCVVV